jgi:ADP-heptose:LPS heptosyltransferase
LAVVLAYRALGLGDFLTGVPALRALARASPDAEHVLAAPAALAPLAELSGAVDELVDTAPLGPPPRGADLAVNLHGKGPESTALLRASLPRRLIAFGGPEAPWRDGEHEVARWCRLLAAYGIPADPGDLALPRPPSPVAPGATVIHPGAASGARRWPAERFAAIARAERAAGRDVFVTGGAGERALASTVAEQAGEATVLAGETDLLELAGVIAHAGRVVCGDTGVAHLATAFGTPSVVLFGPTPPSEWGPPPDRPQHVALWAGARGDPHAPEPHPGLLSISVADVLAAVRSVTDRPRPIPAYG